MPYFQKFSNIPAGMNEVESAVIANSEALAIGDAIVAGTTAATSAFVKGAKGATTAILGVVQYFRPVKASTTSTLNTAEQSSITVSSSNQTTGGSVEAVYVPARLVQKWVATLDRVVTTATGSDGFGFFDMSAGVNGLAEASYVDSVDSTTGASFSSYGKASKYGPNYTTYQVVGFFCAVQ